MRNFKVKLLEENEELFRQKSMVTWLKWTVWEEKVGSTSKRRMEPVKTRGTLSKLLEEFCKMLEKIALHLFNVNWNKSQLQYIRETLRAGQLLQIMDFGQNYLHVFQDEPQSIHWDHTQSTLHPIVNYYICPMDGKLVTEEHLMITSDKTHDKFAVKCFLEKSLEHLRSKEINPNLIIQFSDNCSSQYKSHGPFAMISHSTTPLICCYFGARLGKSAADTVTGRCKLTVKHSKMAR